MLGFTDAFPEATQSAFHVEAGQDFIMDDVHCTGAEADIRDCSHYETHNCGSYEAAGVICNPVNLQSKLELVGGSNDREGILLVNGRPICDDYWDEADAVVACRQLGFMSGTPLTHLNLQSHGTNFIMDDVECTGDEEDIMECSYNRVHNCGTTEGAGVKCQRSKHKLR